MCLSGNDMSIIESGYYENDVRTEGLREVHGLIIEKIFINPYEPLKDKDEEGEVHTEDTKTHCEKYGQLLGFDYKT